MKYNEQFDYLECEGEGVTEVDGKLSVTYFCYPDGTAAGGRFIHGRVEVERGKYETEKELIEAFIKEQREAFKEMTAYLNKEGAV